MQVKPMTQNFMPDSGVVDRALDHIANRSTDRGKDVWREPVENYSSPERLARELSLFKSVPTPFCPSTALKNPGDYIARRAAGTPLIVVRGKDGKPRAFKNACRHRGMILLEEKRNIQGALRCPYHSWCYDLKGRLRATPHVGGPGQNTHAGIDRNTLGLIEVRSHVWFGVVWINVSGDAPAFEDAMSDLLDRWAEFDKPLYHGGAESRYSRTRKDHRPAQR